MPCRCGGRIGISHCVRSVLATASLGRIRREPPGDLAAWTRVRQCQSFEYILLYIRHPTMPYHVLFSVGCRTRDCFSFLLIHLYVLYRLPSTLARRRMLLNSIADLAARAGYTPMNKQEAHVSAIIICICFYWHVHDKAVARAFVVLLFY